MDKIYNAITIVFFLLGDAGKTFLCATKFYSVNIVKLALFIEYIIVIFDFVARSFKLSEIVRFVKFDKPDQILQYSCIEFYDNERLSFGKNIIIC